MKRRKFGWRPFQWVLFIGFWIYVFCTTDFPTDESQYGYNVQLMESVTCEGIVIHKRDGTSGSYGKALVIRDFLGMDTTVTLRMDESQLAHFVKPGDTIRKRKGTLSFEISRPGLDTAISVWFQPPK